MSGVYGKGDDAESIAVVHRALDLGIDFLDSSDMYGWGHNEELLGRALEGRRRGVIGVTFQARTQLKDRQSIQRPAGEFIERVQNPQANRRARTQAARGWNISGAREINREGPLFHLFKKQSGRRGCDRRKPRLFAASDGYMIVNAQRNPQAIKTRS